MGRSMKEFQCSGCHSALGLTDGNVLVIGNVRIENPVILHCLSCGDGSRKREWRPLGINSRADEKRARLAARMALKASERLLELVETHA